MNMPSKGKASKELLLSLPKDPDKIKDIVTYLTFKCGGEYLSATRLMKLFYMAELLSISKTGKRLTSAKFLNWNYGPWSQDVALVADGTPEVVRVEPIETPEGRRGKSYHPGVDKTTVSLSKEETEILDSVIDEWKYKSTDLLVKYSKSSPPFTWSRSRGSIPFEMYRECCEESYKNRELTKKLSDSREEIRRGKVTTLTNAEEIKRFVDSL